MVYDRLLGKGMVSVPTAAEGDCFFIASCETAGLPMTPKMLRTEICNYLEEMIGWFEHGFVGGRPALLKHIAKMREPGVWATALEIMAASHLLLRPIHLITGSTNPTGGTVKVGPPEVISASAWGSTVYLSHFLNWHFEGTRMAPVNAPTTAASSSSVVQSPQVLQVPAAWGGPAFVIEEDDDSQVSPQ